MDHLRDKLDALLAAFLVSNVAWATVYQGVYSILSFIAVTFAVILGGHAVWRLWKTGHNSWYCKEDHDDGK